MRLENGKYCCYLPHQAVYKASSGKFRRVHDGSAKPYKGAVSINDVLEKGPNLTASILHILLVFRKSKFAIKVDIEKAFPQVGISEEDRDVLRCLWIEDGKVVVYRFKRLPFGLSCSPFILQATLRLHLGENNVNEEVKEHFTAGTYVDDFLKGDFYPSWPKSVDGESAVRHLVMKWMCQGAVTCFSLSGHGIIEQPKERKRVVVEVATGGHDYVKCLPQ